MTAKRSDECLFCKSRSCYEHVYSSDDHGKKYNEIACLSHIKELHKHSDNQCSGVIKQFVSSCSKVNRKHLEV